MRLIKVGAGVMVVVSCFIILFLYYWYHSSTPSSRYKMTVSKLTTTRPYIRITNIPMKHMPLNEIYKDVDEKDDSSFELVETKPGNKENAIK